MTKEQYFDMIDQLWRLNGGNLDKAKHDAELYLELNEIEIKG